MAKPITTSNSINQLGRKWKRHVPEEEKLKAFFESDETGQTELLYKFYNGQTQNNKSRN